MEYSTESAANEKHPDIYQATPSFGAYSDLTTLGQPHGERERRAYQSDACAAKSNGDVKV